MASSPSVRRGPRAFGMLSYFASYVVLLLLTATLSAGNKYDEKAREREQRLATNQARADPRSGVQKNKNQPYRKEAYDSYHSISVAKKKEAEKDFAEARVKYAKGHFQHDNRSGHVVYTSGSVVTRAAPREDNRLGRRIAFSDNELTLTHIAFFTMLLGIFLTLGFRLQASLRETQDWVTTMRNQGAQVDVMTLSNAHWRKFVESINV
ncbi:hypothetical protein CYMTET_29526 [Cymbomonas tetramitiformis]|uniref:Uncharacterized protein n=1 Tax=Cymbomonas tetramitiformis TaxID=36881 RepID=A0AAE0KUV2_9CHLO|nr:hypothetical protein CYMTET_29526 [Cymbomonas tetramitiformis]